MQNIFYLKLVFRKYTSTELSLKNQKCGDIWRPLVGLRLANFKGLFEGDSGSNFPDIFAPKIFLQFFFCVNESIFAQLYETIILFSQIILFEVSSFK